MLSAEVLDESEQLPRRVLVVPEVIPQLLQSPDQRLFLLLQGVKSLYQGGDIHHRGNLVMQELGVEVLRPDISPNRIIFDSENKYWKKIYVNVKKKLRSHSLANECFSKNWGQACFKTIDFFLNFH